METNNYSGRHTPKNSTTLSRKYVARPWKDQYPAISHFATPKNSPVTSNYSTKSEKSQGAADSAKIAPAVPHPMQARAMDIMRKKKAPVHQKTAKELKDAAIKKALAEAGITAPQSSTTAQTITSPQSSIVTEENAPFLRELSAAGKTKNPAKASQHSARLASSSSPVKSSASLTEIAKQSAKEAQKSVKKAQKSGKSGTNFSFGRFLIAFSASIAAVFSIIYFANLGSPDISFSVAAAESGFSGSYPSYIPRDFTLEDITSSEDQISMIFKNSSTGDSFRLIEETSSWDSDALEKNYVKSNFKDYSTVREQGLTIYLGDSSAAWVSGGVAYKISPISGSLTKKQLVSIATSI